MLRLDYEGINVLSDVNTFHNVGGGEEGGGTGEIQEQGFNTCSLY